MASWLTDQEQADLAYYQHLLYQAKRNGDAPALINIAQQASAYLANVNANIHQHQQQQAAATLLGNIVKGIINFVGGMVEGIGKLFNRGKKENTAPTLSDKREAIAASDITIPTGGFGGFSKFGPIQFAGNRFDEANGVYRPVEQDGGDDEPTPTPAPTLPPLQSAPTPSFWEGILQYMHQFANYWRGTAIVTPTPTILYFGGSAGGPNADTNHMLYGNTSEPFIIGQAPFLANAADILVPYPGTPNIGPNGEIGKELQALNGASLLSSGDNVIVLGYSAGADAALIFSYRYIEQFNIIGVGLLGGSFDGNINNNFDGLIKLDQITMNGNVQWQEMLDGILANEIRVYILDDNVPAPNLHSYFITQQYNPNFCYDAQLTLNHFGDINEGVNHTNRNPNIPINALNFIQNGDRSSCQ